MCERKVYRLSANMEGLCIKEDPEIRLYLSEVQRKKKKRSIRFRKIIIPFLELCFSFIVSYFIGRWAIDYAYRERGYTAIGGEYFLIIMVFGISFWAISSVLERR